MTLCLIGTGQREPNQLGLDEESKQIVLENRSIPSGSLPSDEEEASSVSCTSLGVGLALLMRACHPLPHSLLLQAHWKL